MSEAPRPPSSADALKVDAVTSLADARRLGPEWSDLHERSATTNPFTHPSWALTWAEHFVGEHDVYVITVRQNGVLIGVAPMYWERFGTPRRAAFRALRLLGNGPCAQFTEIPGVLAEQHEHRNVFRAVVRFLQREAPRWDWVKVTLDGSQGWFEPQWLLKKTEGYPPFEKHHDTRACVILDLPESWGEFLASRKKNVRESIRRSTNRLNKRVTEWSVDPVIDEPELTAALTRTVGLHRARSDMTGKPNHPTMFGQKAAQPFYVAAVTAMAKSGKAEVSVLRCRGEIVAGLVALRAGAQVYISVTGADPAAWEFGPGTILTAELARREIALGTRGINLSAGPNQSKLRWSERLEFNHDFLIGGEGSAARAKLFAFSQLSNLAALRRALQWDTATDDRV